MAPPPASRSWQLNTTGTKGQIWVSFEGPTPSAEIPGLLMALTAAMPDSGAKLVFDLRHLEGYNPDTKEPFKEWLARHKLQIDEVIVLVPKANVILRMVIAAIALAVGVKIRIAETPEETDEIIPSSP